MPDWIDLNGPILADTVYREGVLCARDVTVTLPSVTPLTNEYRAGGTMSLPILGLTEAMEASLTKIGIDMGLRRMLRLESAIYEFRWVQDSKDNSGNSHNKGCKAFLRCIPKGIPGLTIDPGSTSDNEVGMSVTRYQLIVAGEEYWHIDKLNGILRIDGVDYAKEINNLL